MSSEEIKGNAKKEKLIEFIDDLEKLNKDIDKAIDKVQTSDYPLIEEPVTWVNEMNASRNINNRLIDGMKNQLKDEFSYNYDNL